MAKHFKYGGSTAARTLACPSWQRLSAEMPVEVGTGHGSEAAMTGSLLHECMEEKIGDGIDFADQLLKGRTYGTIELTSEMLTDKLVPAENALITLCDTYDITEFDVEPMVAVDADIGGSIDYIGSSRDGKTVLVADYKFGYNRVDVEDNAQLLFYAWCASVEPDTADFFENAERVVIAVIQPTDDLEEANFTQSIIRMNALDEFETKFLKAVVAAEDVNSAPVAGDHCTYCRAAALCPAKTGLALKATRMTGVKVAELATLIPMAEQLEKWIKEVKKVAHEQLELGTAIEGYKLVNKRAARVWTDQVAVEDTIRKAKKLKLTDGFDYKLKSPAQLEKVCKEKKIDFKKYSEYIASVSSGTTMAKASDKRSEVAPIVGLEQLNQLN